MIIGTPFRKGAGYFVNNQDDPSLKQEADVVTCSHCQAVVLLQQWQKKGAFCHKCNSPICIACGKAGGCSPFEAKFEKFYEEQQKLAQSGEPAPTPSIIIAGS